MVNCGTSRVYNIYFNKRSLRIVAEVTLGQRLDDLQCRERPTNKARNVNPCKSESL